MAEIVWTEPALHDLDAMAEYIALDSPAAANRLVQAIFDQTARLQTFPLSGRVPPELSDSVYREVVLPPCRIFYRVDEDLPLLRCGAASGVQLGPESSHPYITQS